MGNYPHLEQLGDLFRYVHLNEAQNLPNDKFEEFKTLIEEWVKKFENLDNVYIHYNIIEMEEQVVGFVGIVQSGEDIELSSLVVDPKHQGKGYGSQLLEWAIDKSSEKGYNKVVLWTYEHMKAAIALYEKYDFIEESLPYKDAHINLNPIYMVKYI